MSHLDSVQKKQISKFFGQVTRIVPLKYLTFKHQEVHNKSIYSLNTTYALIIMHTRKQFQHTQAAAPLSSIIQYLKTACPEQPHKAVSVVHLL